ncbi:hypothetical protein BMS3Abin08_01743 [bacterium BMS3Abin08]|nr:hypothetical protein BMS3Abin08_01743 [bacterium BMS3Abin08]
MVWATARYQLMEKRSVLQKMFHTSREIFNFRNIGRNTGHRKCPFYRSWVIQICAINGEPHVVNPSELVDYCLTDHYRGCPFYLNGLIRHYDPEQAT